MNNIPSEQNAPKQLELLAAQRQIYSQAKNIQTTQWILAIPCVVILAIISTFQPNIKVYSALWGISITFFDILLFSRLQRALRRDGAKIQELFDCETLQLSWNHFKVGRRPDAEKIHEYSSKLDPNSSKYKSLLNWYPLEVGKLPLPLARLVCQRANCWWDSNLRRRYASTIIIVLGVVTVLVFSLGLVDGLSLDKFLLGILAPLLPMFSVGMRQFDEHSETASTSERLKEHAEDLWGKALSQQISFDQLDESSRDLQNEIYDRRRNSPFVLDWVYYLLRQKHEEQMNKSAEGLVKEALKVFPTP